MPSPDLKVQSFEMPDVRSLVWQGDALVDWAGGGSILHLDGTIEEARVRYAYRFDAAVVSPCNRYAVIYEKCGTKGLVLDHGSVVREIDRSFYHAGAYEYPLAIFQRSDGQVVLAHCPEHYNQLELEDLHSGERLSVSEGREPPDFFHSRLRVSLGGGYLLSAGWIWHPLDAVNVYDLERALVDSSALDAPLGLPEIDREVCSAEFLTSKVILLGFGAEFDEPIEDSSDQFEVALIDLDRCEILTCAKATEPLGTLLPVSSQLAISLYDHPKLLSIADGTVLTRCERIASGQQDSSILMNREAPTMAFDQPNGRVAIASPESVTVISVAG